MKPRWSYLITPKNGKEYNNLKRIGDQDLVVNTSIEDASYVNRLGVVSAVPAHGANGPKVGDVVVVHHNVFRTYFDMKGNQRKSNEYFRDGQYLVSPERIYMYHDGEDWKCTEGYCFVRPIDYIQSGDLYRTEEKEEEHVGLVKTSSIYEPGTRVGFTKNSEYQFDIEDEKVYRMREADLCILF